MDIKKAKKVLATNVLDLSLAAMSYMPMKTVEIDTFEIMNNSKTDPGDDETDYNEKAYLLGLVGENNKTSSRKYRPEGDLFCCSFMVKRHYDYYYRENFSGAMEVIEALRTVNEYKDPYPDESVTMTI